MNKELLDKLGNKLIPGDVVLELGRGFGTFGEDSPYKYWMKLWEMPESFDGHGILYNMDGEPHEFAWAHPAQSFKIDFSKMPDDFEYSFRHGMSDIKAKSTKGDLLTIISQSDWIEHKIIKSEVDNFKLLQGLKLESIDDIKDNLKALSESSCVPHDIMHKVLGLTTGKIVMPVNGEIGIAHMQNSFRYGYIMEVLTAVK